MLFNAGRKKRVVGTDLLLIIFLFVLLGVLGPCHVVLGKSGPPFLHRQRYTLPLKSYFPILSRPPPPTKKTVWEITRLGMYHVAMAVLQITLAAESTTVTAKSLEKDPTWVVGMTNFAIHLGWVLAHEIARQEKDEVLLVLMNFLFVLKPNDLTEGRYHTMLLAGFSHESQEHLLSNMGALVVFGPKVARHLGTRVFSYFYVAAIYASSLFDQFVYSPLFRPKYKKFLHWKLPVGTLGASGALSALMTYYCLQYPLDPIDVSAMLDSSQEDRLILPAWSMEVLAVLLDIFGTDPTIGYGAHIGGHIFGALVFVGSRLWIRYVRWRRNRKRRERRERFVRQDWRPWRRFSIHRWTNHRQTNSPHRPLGNLLSNIGRALGEIMTKCNDQIREAKDLRQEKENPTSQNPPTEESSLSPDEVEEAGDDGSVKSPGDIAVAQIIAGLLDDEAPNAGDKDTKS